jgi:hypothetical protein
MGEYTSVDTFASFGATCCLCTFPRPVHKEGMCASHYAEFGGKAWKGAAAKKPRGFSLTPLHKDGPRTPKRKKVGEDG